MGLFQRKYHSVGVVTEIQSQNRANFLGINRVKKELGQVQSVGSVCSRILDHFGIFLLMLTEHFRHGYERLQSRLKERKKH